MVEAKAIKWWRRLWLKPKMLSIAGVVLEAPRWAGRTWEIISSKNEFVELAPEICSIAKLLPPNIAGSIYPPVTKELGDEVHLDSTCPAEHVDSPP